LSAILEALKRIEREPQQTGLQPLPQQLDPRKSLEKRLRKRWFRRRMITLSFLLPILGVGTWAAIQYKAWLNPWSNLPSVSSDAHKDKTNPVVVAPKSRGSKTSSLPIGGKKPGQAVLPRPQTSEEAGFVPSGTRSFVPNADRSLKSKPREVRPETQEASPAIQIKRSPLQSPGESEFKLDALVWSSNPKSRFAVINGQIVRAGESVRGASITEIERDHVGLKSGNRTWELRLNIQSKSP
jgi:Type II secretion system protein B